MRSLINFYKGGIVLLRYRLKLVALLLIFSVSFLGFIPQITMASLLTQQTGAQSSSAQSDKASSFRKKDVQRLSELTEMRNQNTKYFRNSDGSITAETSLNSRHYKDDNGKWQDISNRLVSSEETDFALRNEANSFNTHLANTSQAQFLAKLRLDQISALAWTMDNVNNVNSTNTEESVTYPNIQENIDLQYIPYSDGIKENIILKNSNATNVFNFKLTLTGLKPVAQDDGSIILQDSSSGEAKLVLPKPFMLDAKEQFSDTVSMSVEPTQNPNVYSVVITADSNWLNAPERLYPVTIDPTVKTLNATGSIGSDTYVAEYSPYYYYNSTYMTTGWDSGFGRTRAFLKFNLPTLPSGAIVTDALLSLYK